MGGAEAKTQNLNSANKLKIAESSADSTKNAKFAESKIAESIKFNADSANLLDLAKNPHFYFDDSFGRRVFEDYLEVLINPIKSLWRGKKVVVVEGFNSYFGVYNDLLDSASEVIRLNSYPPFDAFSKIDEILEDVMRVARKYEKDEICFIVALGASAKIICVELAMRGYVAYDMGNMSISYDCIIHKKDRKLIDTLNLQKEYILML